MPLPMKAIKNKIKTVIKRSNGFPNFTRAEYLESVRSNLERVLSPKDKKFIASHRINLDPLIMEITAEITEDIF